MPLLVVLVETPARCMRAHCSSKIRLVTYRPSTTKFCLSTSQNLNPDMDLPHGCSTLPHFSSMDSPLSNLSIHQPLGSQRRIYTGLDTCPTHTLLRSHEIAIPPLSYGSARTTVASCIACIGLKPEDFSGFGSCWETHVRAVRPPVSAWLSRKKLLPPTYYTMPKAHKKN
jgi:hypothetical protein